MKKVVNISDMFHDDSFEGYNFWLADKDNAEFLGGGEEFAEFYPEYVEPIKKLMKEGKSYLCVNDDQEIQWG